MPTLSDIEKNNINLSMVNIIITALNYYDTNANKSDVLYDFANNDIETNNANNTNT